MTNARRLLVCVLLPWALVLVFATASAKNPSDREEWRVRHKLTNDRHEAGTPLLLRVSKSSIQAFDGKQQVLNIPPSQVVAVTADDDTHRPVRQWLLNSVSVASKDAVRQAFAQPLGNDLFGIKRLSGMLCAGGSVVSCNYKDTNFMATMVGDVVMAGVNSLIESHTQYRCIDIVWMEDGVLRDALFHVSEKKQEVPLLDALAAATGKTWVDLAEKRRLLRHEFEQYNHDARPVTLDRTVLIGGETVRPGEYRLVLIPREHAVELDFFRGDKVSPERFLAQATAQADDHARLAGGAASSATTVHYIRGESSAEISEIVTGDLVLVTNLAASAVTGAVVSPTTNAASAAAGTPTGAPSGLPPQPVSGLAPPAAPVGTMSGGTSELLVLALALGDSRADVTLVTYHGRRAFRFPVEHIHRKHGLGDSLEECAGSLYIMADQIAFDAGLNLHKDRDPFDVARSEIKEFKIVPRSLTSWGTIRVVVGKKKYDFMPYFSNTQSPLANVPPPGSGSAGAVSMISGGRQLWKVGTAGRPMLDAFMDAMLDFQRTEGLVESGKYLPKPHRANETSQKSYANEPTNEPDPMKPKI